MKFNRYLFLNLFISFVLIMSIAQYDTVLADCSNPVEVDFIDPFTVSDGMIDGPYVVGNNNTTVTDLGTGLMWQKADDGNGYVWTDACEYCENATFGGYNNWKLPDIYQLYTILDIYYTPIAINTNYFSNTMSEKYWSNSFSVAPIYCIDFGSGSLLADFKNNTNYNMVRCVRVENPLPKGPLALLISASKTNGYTPLEVTFTSTVTGGAYPYYPSPYIFSWNFGDVKISSSDNKNPTVIYQHPGVFKAICTVKDLDGASITKTIIISASSDPASIGCSSKVSASQYGGGAIYNDGIDGPYIDNKDETVTDQGTRLMWQKNDDGNQYERDAACEYCEDLVLGTHSDWMLPDIFQLDTILDTQYSPPINSAFFNNTSSDYYWSGSKDSFSWWYMSFINGKTFKELSIASNMTAYVRCVRVLEPIPQEAGSLTVTILPANAVTAGAQWKVDSGVWKNSGDTVSNLSVNSHNVEFKDITGWTKPANKPVTIQNGQNLQETGTYISATDDYGNNCTSAQVVNPNSTTNGKIEVAGDYDYFKITLPSQGTLKVYTSGSLDTLGYLKDSACTDISDDDDNGDSSNFLISEDLSAGTYYIAVGSYNSSLGDYTLNVEFSSLSIPLPTVTTEPATAVTSDYANLHGTVNPNGLSTTCYFELGISTSYGIKSEIFDAGNGIVSKSFDVDAINLPSDKTYHFRFVAENSAGTTYGSDQTFKTDASPTDDYGNNCSSAQVVNPNSTTNGKIEVAGDYDYFKVTLPSQGTLKVYTSGSLDTLGYLKDSVCTDISDDDDNGDSSNFLISEDLSAGTYYIAVGSYNSSLGDYTLNVEFTGVSAGSLTVILSPENAITAGAQWKVDSGSWNNSGDTVSNLSVGSHNVEFKDITGWTKPSATNVNVQNGQTSTINGVYTYTPPPDIKPTVTTGSASSITSTSATLNGTLNPNGTTTTYWFEYGKTATYGFVTPAADGGSGTTIKTVPANLTGLATGTTYNFRLVATNSAGTTYGSNQFFTTTSTQPESVTSYKVLTNQSGQLTITYGEYVRVFGSSGGNTINVQSGGKVECVNFIGSNIINTGSLQSFMLPWA